MLFDADWARSWTTTAVRCAERLMQIEVHHVETHVAWAGNAQYGIGVRAVVVELSPGFVNQRRDLGDIAIKKSQRVGVGQHDGGNIGCIRIQQSFQMLHVDAARLGIALHLHSFIVGERGTGGIGAMGVVGNEHKIAMPLSLALMVGLDQHQACQFAMRASGRLEGDTRHAGDFGQVLFNFVE